MVHTKEVDLAREVVDLAGGFVLLHCACREGNGCMEFPICGGAEVEMSLLSGSVIDMKSGDVRIVSCAHDNTTY